MTNNDGAVKVDCSLGLRTVNDFFIFFCAYTHINCVCFALFNLTELSTIGSSFGVRAQVNMLKNTNTSYGLLAIVLHWLVAVWIIGLFVLGWYMVDLGYYDDWYQTAPQWHKSLGILLALTMVVRLLWRWFNPKPHISGSPMVKKAAEVVHTLLYGWVGLVIVSGYLISTADGRAIEVFDWFEIPATLTGIANQEDIAGVVHWYLAVGLLSMAALHALAAIKHQLIDRDGTLSKMFKTQ
jgi:cytochrome b561